MRWFSSDALVNLDCSLDVKYMGLKHSAALNGEIEAFIQQYKQKASPAVSEAAVSYLNKLRKKYIT